MENPPCQFQTILLPILPIFETLEPQRDAFIRALAQSLLEKPEQRADCVGNSFVAVRFKPVSNRFQEVNHGFLISLTILRDFSRCIELSGFLSLNNIHPFLILQKLYIDLKNFYARVGAMPSNYLILANFVNLPSIKGGNSYAI